MEIAHLGKLHISCNYPYIQICLKYGSRKYADKVKVYTKVTPTPSSQYPTTYQPHITDFKGRGVKTVNVKKCETFKTISL